MASSKALSGITIFFGLFGFSLMMAALCTNRWLQRDNLNNGLWKNCTNDACDDLIIGRNRIYTNYEMVRGFGILSVFLTLLGTVFTLVDIVTKKDIGASVMATIFLMSALFALISIAFFTSLSQRASSFSWGYSFGLGWAAFPSTLVAGLVMVYVEFKSK